MACPICTDGLGEHDSVLTSCGHVYHQVCLAQWWRVGGDCPLCRAPLPEDETMGLDPPIVAETLDDLLLSLAKYVDGADAAQIVLCAAPSDPVFTHAVRATFHRLFDPEHTVELPARLPRSVLITYLARLPRSTLITHLVLASQPILDVLLQPPQFKKPRL